MRGGNQTAQGIRLDGEESVALALGPRRARDGARGVGSIGDRGGVEGGRGVEITYVINDAAGGFDPLALRGAVGRVQGVQPKRLPPSR
eukprot:2197223-Pyramimonas_sp.AAC.1